MNVNRPNFHLNQLIGDYPALPALIEKFRNLRGQDNIPEWPLWCFLPMAAWYAIICEAKKVSQLTIPLANDISRLAAIGAWRYSQGIYQIHPALLNALSNSVVAGNLPSEVFQRLPEGSIYVETPHYVWLNNLIHGFWAHLEWDVNTHRSELRLLIDGEQGFLAIILHLGAWTVTEAIDRGVSEAKKNAFQKNISFSIDPDNIELLAQGVNSLVSIILYLCSQEPEINDLKEPDACPSYPQLTKTKRGWRLFPPDKPKLWSVGTTVGEQLQQYHAAQNEHEINKLKKRTHLRRGHWHGYWTGSKMGERKFIYHWISPLIVQGQKDSTETLPK